MTMVCNNRDDRFDLNGRNGGDSFQEHNERMRRFRKSHGHVLKVRVQRHDKPTREEAMRAFRSAHDKTETMESRSLGRTVGLLTISLARRVMLSVN